MYVDAGIPSAGGWNWLAPRGSSLLSCGRYITCTTAAVETRGRIAQPFAVELDPADFARRDLNRAWPRRAGPSLIWRRSTSEPSRRSQPAAGSGTSVGAITFSDTGSQGERGQALARGDAIGTVGHPRRALDLAPEEDHLCRAGHRVCRGSRPGGAGTWRPGTGPTRRVWLGCGGPGSSLTSWAVRSRWPTSGSRKAVSVRRCGQL